MLYFACSRLTPEVLQEIERKVIAENPLSVLMESSVAPIWKQYMEKRLQREIQEIQDRLSDQPSYQEVDEMKRQIQQLIREETIKMLESWSNRIYLFIYINMINLGNLSLEDRGPIFSRIASFSSEKKTLKKVCQAWQEVFNQTILDAILATPLDLRVFVLSKIVSCLTPKENALVLRISKQWQIAAQSSENLYLFGLMQSYAGGFVSSFRNPTLLKIENRMFQCLDPGGKVLGRYLERQMNTINSKKGIFDFLNGLIPEQKQLIRTLELRHSCLKDITDDDVAQLLTLCLNVRVLYMDSTVATGFFLPNMKGRLTNLVLVGDQISEDNIKEFVKENSQLIELMIISDNVCGNFLEGLSDCNKIEVFFFRSNRIQEVFLKHISKMSSLKSLSIISNQVSGSFLSSIPASLKKLRLESRVLAERSLYTFFLRFSSLELLDISSDTLQGSFFNVLSSHNRVQQLSLQGSSFLDYWLGEGMRKCGHLKRLQVFSSGLGGAFLWDLPNKLEVLYTDLGFFESKRMTSSYLQRLLTRTQGIEWNLKGEISDEIEKRNKVIKAS